MESPRSNTSHSTVRSKSNMEPDLDQGQDGDLSNRARFQDDPVIYDTDDTDTTKTDVKGDLEGNDEASALLDLKGSRDIYPKITQNYHTERRSSEESYHSDYRSHPIASPIMETRIGFDGRELTFVSLNTQTDWDWVEDKLDEMIKEEKYEEPPQERVKIVEPVVQHDIQPVGSKSTTRDPASRGKTDGTLTSLDTTSIHSPFSMPYNDEFGIPLLDMPTSEDDSSDDEGPQQNPVLLPSVGPPQILQYVRESEMEEPEVPTEEKSETELITDYMGDEESVAIGIYNGECEFCFQLIRPFPTLEQQQELPPEDLYCCEQYREFVQFATSAAIELEEETKKTKRLINIKPHAHFGSKKERKAAKERAVQRMRDRELQKRQQEASGLQSHYVARQMKTINYQLSSQKCLEEGWTVRPPTPIMDDPDILDIFVPEPLDFSFASSAKVRQKQLIQKFYENGKTFLTYFPDGTGTVFYPSGFVAVSISKMAAGQFVYVLHENADYGRILAYFEPNGHGCCYHPNGNIRLYYDELDGLELDSNGGKKKKWCWKDKEKHVHAPPFQPICIGLNRSLGLRVISQEHISLTFMAKNRSCRFNVGSKLKLKSPEKIQPEDISEYLVFREEKAIAIETILDKVSNLLRFPNSPKIDKILPPLRVTHKMQRVEELRELHDRQRKRRLFPVRSTTLSQGQGSSNTSLPAVTVN